MMGFAGKVERERLFARRLKKDARLREAAEKVKNEVSGFAFKMMNFALKLMSFALQLMSFSSQLMDFGSDGGEGGASEVGGVRTLGARERQPGTGHGGEGVGA